jgi:hypothetical protein
MKLSHVTDCYVPKARPTTSGANGFLVLVALRFRQA